MLGTLQEQIVRGTKARTEIPAHLQEGPDFVDTQQETQSFYGIWIWARFAARELVSTHTIFT